jgi:predicted RNA binding protein YcfA (HicA-like mRNA interferase family)
VLVRQLRNKAVEQKTLSSPLRMAGRRESEESRGVDLPICYSSYMKVNEILAILKEDGWYLVAIRGRHRQFKHPVKSGRVTVAGKPSDDLAPGTLNSIVKQASLKE